MEDLLPPFKDEYWTSFSADSHAGSVRGGACYSGLVAASRVTPDYLPFVRRERPRNGVFWPNSNVRRFDLPGFLDEP